MSNEKQDGVKASREVKLKGYISELSDCINHLHETSNITRKAVSIMAGNTPTDIPEKDGDKSEGLYQEISVLSGEVRRLSSKIRSEIERL